MEVFYTMSSKVSSETGSKSGSWDSAILEAERQILLAKERLAGLRSALRVFKQERKAATRGRELLGQKSNFWVKREI
jgi:hypothetical protein